MPATITNKEKNKLPDWAVSTMNQIEDLGFFNWTFDWERPVPNPAEAERVQVREEGHVGQIGEVIKYAEAMKRGDKFPPVVLTSDGYIVDGNTRQRAAYKLDRTEFPAFIINESFYDAEEFVKQRFHILGAAFNTGGPKPLTREELSKQVRQVAADSDQWDTNTLSRHLNVKRNVVQNIFAEFRAETRAERLGVALNGGVNPSARALLGGRSDKLSDDVFREIAQLAQDAGLTNQDLGNLCKTVIDVTTGDAHRLDIVATERDARQQQIAGFRSSGKRKPPLSSRVRTSLDFLVQHEGNVKMLLDNNPSTREHFYDLLTRSQEILNSLAAEQRKVNKQGALV